MPRVLSRGRFSLALSSTGAAPRRSRRCFGEARSYSDPVTVGGIVARGGYGDIAGASCSSYAAASHFPARRRSAPARVAARRRCAPPPSRCARPVFSLVGSLRGCFARCFWSAWSVLGAARPLPGSSGLSLCLVPAPGALLPETCSLACLPPVLPSPPPGIPCFLGCRRLARGCPQVGCACSINIVALSLVKISTELCGSAPRSSIARPAHLELLHDEHRGIFGVRPHL